MVSEISKSKGIPQLGREILFFDGAMGTQLQARGLKLRELPEALNLTRPEVVRQIHRSYLEAGADFVTTNTFGANPFKAAATGYSVEELVRAGTLLAREAASAFPRARVALDIGPSGKILEPLGDASFEEIYQAVCLQVRAGAPLCDVVLLETFTDLYELKASILAVKDCCDLPIFATMTFEEGGRTFFGAGLESMVLTLEALGVDALGLNCSLGPEQLLPLVEQLCGLTSLPVMVQPNAGLPVMDRGASVYDVTSEHFAAQMARFAERGCAILGGCCGTGPDYIAKTVQAVGRALRPRTVARRPGICSAARAVWFDDVVVIGERLNPTGKKALQAALRSQDYGYLLQEALKQQDQGAQVLDLNVGLPDIDEAAVLKKAVMEIQGVLNLPLQIDSADAAAIEAAVRIYNGKPLINSVNAKESSLQTVLPIAKKYGAAVVALTLDESGIPPTAEARVALARKILDRALELGIPREDLFIDCLTLTASAQQDQVAQTLKALRMVKEDLGLPTVLGVSNVSFGLPQRPAVNRTMLALALAQGLKGAIMNPGDGGMQETLAAYRVLAGKDRDAQAWIQRCAGMSQPSLPEAAAQGQPAPPEPGDSLPGGALASAIAGGLKDQAREVARQLLDQMAPLQVVEDHIVPALDGVGQDYEAQRIFLPQLIKAAEAAKAAFQTVQEALVAAQEEGAQPEGMVVLATVKGDVHDIGKNIVKVLLENYNFRVLDLGKDVAPEVVVQAVKDHHPPLVGLSALMTTTVATMKDTIALLRQHCPGVRIAAGGAVLTPELARYVDADFYVRDAMETVRVASQVCRL